MGERAGFKHKEVARLLLARVAATAEGARLPSVRALMREYGASQQTVVRAIEMLAGRGLLDRRPRKGIFVRKRGWVRPAGELKLLAVSMPAINTSFYSILMQGIQESARARGYDTLLWVTLNDMERELGFLSDFGEGQALGLIALTTSEALASPQYVSRIHELRDQGRPIVSVDIPLPGFPAESFVGLDNFEIGRAAGRYLFGKGLRRIAYVRKRESLVAADRLSGFCAAAGECGIRLRDGDILFVPYPKTDDDVAGTIERIAALSPDAVFVATTTLAARIIRELYRARVLTEEDIRLAAIVEEDFADTVFDPLYAVVKPGHALGGRAAERLMDLVEGKTVAIEERRLAPRLVEVAAKPRMTNDNHG